MKALTLARYLLSLENLDSEVYYVINNDGKKTFYPITNAEQINNLIILDDRKENNNAV